VLDCSDSEDVLNLLRDELGCSRKSARFPKKATCLAIYSHAVNAQRSVEETLAARERFLTELTLDPPNATGDEAGISHLDEDYLILSTIHSAKGQEWDVVYVLNAVDGCIPSDMATDSPEHIEEERRLLYVAMTRARDHLYLVHPLRFFTREQQRHGDRHVYVPRTRFIPDSILGHFERRTHVRTHAVDPSSPTRVRVDVAARLRAMWS
jgi:DNA helicase-2/ATP-dependent DNA helicase PcrA